MKIIVFGGYLECAFAGKVAETGGWSLFMREKEGYVSIFIFFKPWSLLAFKIALNKRYRPYYPAETSMILTAAFIP